jgi:hypothetical protein
MAKQEKSKKEAKKELEVNVSEVLDYMRIQGTFETALADVVRRKVTVAAAKKAGLKVTDKELQKGVDVYRIALGLHKAQDVKDLLASRGVSQEALEDFVETNLLIHAFKDQLEKKAEKNKYVGSPEVKAALRNVIYHQWVAQEMK